MKQDLGLSTELFTKLNHLVIDSIYAEFLFFLTFSPQTPVFIDSTGIHLDLLMHKLLKESSIKLVSAADYFISDVIREQIPG